MLDAKLERPHTAVCHFNGSGANSRIDRKWVLPERTKLDGLGRKHRSTNRCWVRFICNDPSCHATLVVRSEAILEHFAVPLGATDGGKGGG